MPPPSSLRRGGVGEQLEARSELCGSRRIALGLARHRVFGGNRRAADHGPLVLLGYLACARPC